MSSPVASRSWTDQNYNSAPRTLRSIQKIPSSKNKNKGKQGDLYQIYMTQQYLYRNRFHVAVLLLNNIQHMTSKRGKNKKVAHEA